jgi:hypothetical protein
MTAKSMTVEAFANRGGARTCTVSTAIGSINSAIVGTVREIYSSKTAEMLAVWLKISLRTAKHRLAGSREFTIDEIAALLHSQHGFRVLGAIMERAPRKPSWWSVCEPLMDLADAELLVEAIRQRTSAAIAQREENIDALTTEIRHTQTAVIHGSGPARAHLDALESFSRAPHRMVAAKRRQR